jgi:hypothetical protein
MNPNFFAEGSIPPQGICLGSFSTGIFFKFIAHHILIPSNTSVHDARQKFGPGCRKSPTNARNNQYRSLADSSPEDLVKTL